MSKQNHRSIGALIGLSLGAAMMHFAGLEGVMPLAICGATGAVAGGITGEKIFYARDSRDETP